MDFDEKDRPIFKTPNDFESSDCEMSDELINEICEEVKDLPPYEDQMEFDDLCVEKCGYSLSPDITELVCH